MTEDEKEVKRDPKSAETQRCLIAAYGGRLVSLATFGEQREELASRVRNLPSINLGPQALSDLELLAMGAFSPLDRFMCSRECRSVLDRGRLTDGTLFPVPVLLSVCGSGLRLDQEIALRNSKNNLIAWMRIEDIFEYEPDVSGRCYVSGELRVIDLPVHHDFPDLRLTPAEVRKRLMALANPRVVACQPLQWMHRAEEEMTKRAAEATGATLLIQPVAGITRAADIDHYTRVRTYRTLVRRYYNSQYTLLGLLPLSLPDGSPEAALLQAIVARNYGSSHFLVHRSLGHSEMAQELVKSRADELGVTAVVGEDIVYVPEMGCYSSKAEAAPYAKVLSLPANEAKEQYLDNGRPLPEWFTRSETAEILAGAHPPRRKQGFCVWFTGLPCSGKSTIAEVLTSMLFEQGRQVTVLDGDVVRTHLSRGLGFSREDRDTNILRIGFVAAEIVRHQGTVICAAVSPYRSTRDQVRTMVSRNFVEVFVNTPLNVCEQRDVKGFYARARAGQLKGFTGVDDPYEPPEAPEVEIDTVAGPPAQAARTVFEYLRSRGLLTAEAADMPE